MRINDKQFITTDTEKAAENRKAEARKAAANKGNQAGAAGSASAGDTLAISSRARDVVEIASQLKQSSEVREELVLKLRDQIRNGTYNVSGLDIAKSIMNKAEEGIF